MLDSGRAIRGDSLSLVLDWFRWSEPDIASGGEAFVPKDKDLWPGHCKG